MCESVFYHSEASPVQAEPSARSHLSPNLGRRRTELGDSEGPEECGSDAVDILVLSKDDPNHNGTEPSTFFTLSPATEHSLSDWQRIAPACKKSVEECDDRPSSPSRMMLATSHEPRER